MAEIGKEGGGGKGRALAKLHYTREGARKRAEKLAIVTPRCEKKAVGEEEAVFGNKVLQKKKLFRAPSLLFPQPLLATTAISWEHLRKRRLRAHEQAK